jgi:MoaA/NifB/PqqE/SkfB family radical SAM enzyme
MTKVTHHIWPPPPQFESGGRTATPRPSEGVVMWNVNTVCDYRCTYCTERFLADRTRQARNVDRFLAGFSRLPGRWEVKLSGGEPFLHVGLLDIAAGLRELGHRVSVVTNFSSPTERIGKFLVAAGAALRVFSASFHYEYVATKAERETFAQKCQFVLDRLPAQASFSVTCVATREILPVLCDVKRWFERRGIRFKIHPEKQNLDVIAYSHEETELLLRLGAREGLAETGFRFENFPCWAGALSFTLDHRGEAWRCHPARRRRLQYLGNFLDDAFHLADGPSPCLYAHCDFTVPAERELAPRTECLKDEKNGAVMLRRHK